MRTCRPKCGRGLPAHGASQPSIPATQPRPATFPMGSTDVTDAEGTIAMRFVAPLAALTGLVLAPGAAAILRPRCRFRSYRNAPARTAPNTGGASLAQTALGEDDGCSSSTTRAPTCRRSPSRPGCATPWPPPDRPGRELRREVVEGVLRAGVREDWRPRRSTRHEIMRLASEPETGDLRALLVPEGATMSEQKKIVVYSGAG